MRALAVIPARYASERLPGKPLAILRDRTLVEWVYESTRSCSHFDRVVVATDDRAVAETVRGFGGEVELTSSDHRTGTDRVAEVALRHTEFDVVANVQGDQPFVSAALLTDLLRPYLEGRTPDMATLACPLQGDPTDPNVVKVVRDARERALYFSRAPIPWAPGEGEYLHHLGLYAFRREFLRTYAALAPTELEEREGLEQLRALVHGYEIAVSLTREPVLEVNTPGDLERARALVAETATA